MRLADFILANREPILAEWEAFARTCKPASDTMNIEALRDHANEMLTVIAADLATAQSRSEQAEKSKGQAQGADATQLTAAEEHGVGRAGSGFTVEQMVAEYRALRASVIRLWTRHKGELVPADVEDLTRFNEAIDQSLAESVTRYTQALGEAKELFLAILGHDLRLPLGAIYTSATFMIETGELVEPHRTLVARIANSAKRTVGMVGDLLDFTRGRLGGGIPALRAEVNLGRVIHDVVDEIAAAHPDRKIEVETRGEQQGSWDAARLSQVLSNLIGNAVEHGAPDSPVTVESQGEGDEVTIRVHNRGPAIPPEEINGIFSAMKASTMPRKAAPKGPTAGLGLGLYIAERIVAAHGGRITVESTDAEGTTFTVHLPRYEKPARAGSAAPAPAEPAVAG